MQRFLWTPYVRVQKKHRFLTAVVNFVGYLDEKAELPWKETIKNQTPPQDCSVWLTAVPAAFRFFRQQEAAKRKCASYLKSFKTR